MMINTLPIKAVSACLFLISSALAMGSTIQAFGVSSDPFVGHLDQGTPCYLDVLSRQSKKINNEIKAGGWVDGKDFRSRYGKQFSAMSASFICEVQAKELDIQRLPAVVIDERYVIYGINDLQEAKSIYQAYQESHS